MSKQILLIVFTVLPALHLLSGCSSGPPQKIAGTVTKGGKAIPYAQISFVAKTGGGMPVGGQTDSSGKFDLSIKPDQRLKPGTYIVLLSQKVDDKGKPVPPLDPTNPEMDPTKDPVQMDLEGRLKDGLPPELNDPTKSTLTVEIKEGDNTDLQIKVN